LAGDLPLDQETPMPSSLKLALDIAFGAVVPILILNLLTRPLGAPVAYVLAALVPVGWVLADLLLITRQFNVITSIAGLAAIVNGALAFWFVDGLRYALKDSAGLLLMALVFGVSAVVRLPLLTFVFMQVVGADTDERRAAVRDLAREPALRAALRAGTLIIALLYALATVANLILNLNIVTAPFGSETFNSQVAQVNAITRIALPLAAILAFGLAMWRVYAAIDRLLPPAPDAADGDFAFWERLARRPTAPDPVTGRQPGQ
jgi:hypothetical protein